MATPQERIDVNDGKYTVVLDNGKLSALRHGEPWQDLTGNNLVYWLAVELQAARTARDELLAALLVADATIRHRAKPEDGYEPSGQIADVLARYDSKEQP